MYMDAIDKDLELEQLDYFKRNMQTFGVPDDTEQYIDPLKTPLDQPIVLDQEQEKRIIEEIRKKIPEKSEIVSAPKKKLSIKSFFDIISNSFIGLMEDLLNFDGDLESLQTIFTKDDRLVFIGTVVLIVSIVSMMSAKK